MIDHELHDCWAGALLPSVFPELCLLTTQSPTCTWGAWLLHVWIPVLQERPHGELVAMWMALP